MSCHCHHSNMNTSCCNSCCNSCHSDGPNGFGLLLIGFYAFVIVAALLGNAETDTEESSAVRYLPHEVEVLV